LLETNVKVPGARAILEEACKPKAYKQEKGAAAANVQ
jgi:hypothetical protein